MHSAGCATDGTEEVRELVEMMYTFAGSF